MFKKNILPAYPEISFVNTVRDPILSQIVETDAARLNERINQVKTASDEQIDDAILCSQKMAIFYGVPGLIQYVKLHTMVLQHELAKGELVQQQAFNTLSYLQLAQRLYENNPAEVKRLMMQLLPEDLIDSPDYWRDKKTNLIQLGQIEELAEEAASVGDDMFAMCGQSSDSRSALI